ncbi:MAG: hypothetical protein HY427_01530 [Candidatus Levybacteria bacterium]|nr:hypothetical protein [Candidatus Levybacteria bacterium]
MGDTEAKRSPELTGKTISVNLGFLLDSERAELLAGAGAIVEKDAVLRRRLGNEKFDTLKDCVIALLGGNELYIDGIRSLGLNSNMVLNKARSVLIGWRLRIGATKGPSASDLSWDRPFRPLGGTDPRVFEGEEA